MILWNRLLRSGEKKGYKVDGLVLTPKSEYARSSSSSKLLKWKSFEHTTADFRLELMKWNNQNVSTSSSQTYDNRSKVDEIVKTKLSASSKAWTPGQSSTAWMHSTTPQIFSMEATNLRMMHHPQQQQQQQQRSTKSIALYRLLVTDYKKKIHPNVPFYPKRACGWLVHELNTLSEARALNRAVVELSWKKELSDSLRDALMNAIAPNKPEREGGWRFERRRADKPEPNAEWVAKKIVDPREYVTMSELVECAKRLKDDISFSSSSSEKTKKKERTSSDQETCRFFAKTGRCKFGDSCRRLHLKGQPSSFSARSRSSSSGTSDNGGSWRRVGRDGKSSSSSSSSSATTSWRARSTTTSNTTTHSNNTKNNNTTNYYTGSATRRDTKLRPMLDFHNHVKRQNYRKFVPKNSTVLELAGGRGGDLWKLRDCVVSEVMLVDKDSTAVLEAQKRWKNRKPKKQSDFKLNTQVCDLSTRHGKTFQTSTSSKPFQFVSCQFALHYFFKSSETFHCFLNTLTDSIEKGGLFVVTCFDSHRVEKLLSGRDSVDLCQGHCRNDRFS